MPFKKVSEGKYVSPSGRVWTEEQVRLYYATNGFTKKSKSGPKATPKKKPADK